MSSEFSCCVERYAFHLLVRSEESEEEEDDWGGMPTRVVSRMKARRVASSSVMEPEVLEICFNVPAVATFFLLTLDFEGSLLRR